MNASFAEKVVLITGGTSGIGRATAVAFAEQGANVVISGRREAEGAESVSLIQKAGGQGLFVRGDVSEESEIEALVAKTLERFGRLDFAFNNAGVGGEARATMTATADIYNRIMDINVRGVFFSMKHQIPAILQSGGGAIVNNASVLALRPSANSPIYSASKSAVVGLTKSAALELAPKGVRVNAICPAIIETDLTQQIRSDEQSRALYAGAASGRTFRPVGRSRGRCSLSLFTGSILHYWCSLTARRWFRAMMPSPACAPKRFGHLHPAAFPNIIGHCAD